MVQGAPPFMGKFLRRDGEFWTMTVGTFTVSHTHWLRSAGWGGADGTLVPPTASILLARATDA